MISKKPRENLTGMRFGGLTAVNPAPDRFLPSGRHLTMWKCVCECGNIHIARSADLKSGAITSCGCYKAENTARVHTTHGATKNRKTENLYSVWAGIKCRCYCEKEKAYKYYGAKGVTMCEEWKDDFSAFRTWAKENGYKSGLSIDRIDVAGNYCPENCRWADDIVQANNKTTNHFLEWRGATHTIAEWARILGIPYNKLYWKLQKNNWQLEGAVMDA